jgi:drug/metabolite transporter (DMT)-like permease
MAILLALGAALCNAIATILERLGVQSAPADAELNMKLVRHVMRRPIWYLGVATMLGAFGFQITALRAGGLSLVQPILVTELLFLVIILRLWFGRPLGWRESVGTVATVTGLAIFLGVSNQGGGNALPGNVGWAIVIAVCVIGAAAALRIGAHGSRSWKAAWYGIAAGIAFALTAAFMKASTTLLARGGYVFLFEHFEPYAIGICGVAGLFLTQSAYHAGPITASQAALLISDPIASIAIGVGLFGDNLRGGPGTLAVDALALAVMSLGLFVLCHSPLIVSTTTDDKLTRQVREPEMLAPGPSAAPQ